ncbi:hypothetical protein [Bellilinea sp.]|uniref:hypothetical protein n=1 Tax=Bellilinea sp. TaxID=2838785 RepID=UPI002ADD5104|nr:hypothetical protein [Bellilinea sp.]
MKTIVRVFSIIMFLSLLVGFSYSPVEAGGRCPTFIAHITHGIDGTKLGLSQELPVIVEVYFGPNLKLVDKIDLKFKQSFTAELPRGTYLIKVFSVELNEYVESMTTGPVEIPGCKKVIFQARLVGEEAVINVIIRDLAPKPVEVAQ